MKARSLVLSVAAALLAFSNTRAPAAGFAGLGSDATGFAEVLPGKRLVFPGDFGAHPNFRTEWWYVTANLKDSSGQSYGVQWTLFRQSGDPGPQREGWANQTLWMGHAAVSSASTHRFAETLARGGIGQAGVTNSPFHAWIDDWSLADKGVGPPSSEITMTASATEFSYELNLTSSKPPVAHGDQGYSRKSDTGQASYYYSQPFFAVSGTLKIDGRVIAVTGRAWMDREWSSKPLGANQKGWDWFSVHLDSGEKLMVFSLREASGATFRAGTWIETDGTPKALAHDDILLTPGPTRLVGGHELPVSWQIEVKSRNLKVETKALNPETWMGTRIAYWEGPIVVSGSQAGEGYLEMTGY